MTRARWITCAAWSVQTTVAYLPARDVSQVSCRFMQAIKRQMRTQLNNMCNPCIPPCLKYARHIAQQLKAERACSFLPEKCEAPPRALQQRVCASAGAADLPEALPPEQLHCLPAVACRASVLAGAGSCYDMHYDCVQSCECKLHARQLRQHVWLC